MSEELDFTIVTASYNYGAYIAECIESVLNQEGVTCEHLIYDGGSTDDTAEVVGHYDTVKFVQEKDSGMCDAINKGFRAARGKWVMWLNSDDRLLPGALEAVKRLAKGSPVADVIYGGWNFIDAEGNFQRQMTLFPFQPAMLLYLGCYIGSTAAFYRRETVPGEGHYLNENFQYVMDGEYYARLHSLRKKFVYFPRILADFRLHGENLSKKNYGKNGVDSVLSLQLQFSESRAIRRAYGRLNFKNDVLNGLIDAPLYFFWRGVKAILKAIYLGKLKNNGE